MQKGYTILMAKKTGNFGHFNFYQDQLEVIKGSHLKKARGAFGAIGALAGNALDKKKQTQNNAEYTLSYEEIRSCVIDKSMLFGNGITITTNDNFSIKMDLPPKVHFNEIKTLLKKIMQPFLLNNLRIDQIVTQ